MTWMTDCTVNKTATAESTKFMLQVAMICCNESRTLSSVTGISYSP